MLYIGNHENYNFFCLRIYFNVTIVDMNKSRLLKQNMVQSQLFNMLDLFLI